MNRLTWQHLGQILAIPILSAALSAYVTVQVLSTKVGDLDAKLTNLDVREQRHYEEMQLSFRQLYQVLTEHRTR